MGLNDRHSHDVEDASGVRVLGIAQFVITSLADRRPSESRCSPVRDRVLQDRRVGPVRLHGGTNDRVCGLFLGDLSDVECFFVADAEPAPNVRDHVLNGYFHRRRAKAPFPCLCAVSLLPGRRC